MLYRIFKYRTLKGSNEKLKQCDNSSGVNIDDDKYNEIKTTTKNTMMVCTIITCFMLISSVLNNNKRNGRN